MMFSARLFPATRNRYFATALLGLLIAGIATESFAQERKFIVMLAAPVKSMNEVDFDLNTLPNVATIYSAYFDRTNPTVNSFAEYWNEISYGTVNVSGNVFGWAEIPWPVLPLGDYQIDSNATSIAAEIIPWIDLTGGGDDGDGGDEDDEVYDQFAGEDVNDVEQMILIDYNGDLAGTATPGFPPAANVPTPGFADFWPDGMTPCWTPGERFADIDGDGRYDALLEATMDGWADGGEQPPPVCARDGIIQEEEVCDAIANPPQSGVFGDGDGAWDYPEPFEDFIVIYISGCNAAARTLGASRPQLEEYE
ncbi:MAG: hypothetical protein IPK83_08890 [Planctomycetes bacterium]|nr:hypothetical protein [Planctomycetota bacterium]